MTEMEELRQANKQLESKIEEDDQKFSELANTIDTLKQNNEYLNSDYELSLKKKAIFEQ
jgi:HPt (histidine-containing phosphotransfer) domain-containing protein